MLLLAIPLKTNDIYSNDEGYIRHSASVLRLIVLVAIAFFNLTQGLSQTRDAMTDNLISQGLLKKREAKKFHTLLQSSDTITKATYLSTLFQTEFRRLTGSYFSPIATQITFSHELDSAERSRLNTTLAGYLTKLENAGLLDESQSATYYGQIKNNTFYHQLEMLSAIAAEVSFSEYMNRDDLTRFARGLQQHSIVTQKLDNLFETIESEQMQDPLDFLLFCDYATIIEESNYPAEPEEYLELIHRKTAEVLPDLAFSGFTFRVELDTPLSDPDTRHYYFVVSLTHNGRRYSHRSYYRLHSLEKDEFFGDKIDQQEYYKIFNKVLADSGSPYRLHEVKAYNGRAVEPLRFGIIALTKQQAEFLHGGGVYFTPSYESFRHSLTTAEIEHAIAEYRKIGLLDHLSEAEIAKARESVLMQENNSLNSVLCGFPKIVYGFDMEMSNVEEPYEELLQELSEISRGEFRPTDVSDNFDIGKERCTVRFTFNGKPYTQTFEVDGDWYDPAVFEFISSVVAANNLSGTFFQLYEGGQGAMVIYLTPQQYQHIRTNKLAVFADEWERMEE